MGVGKRYLINIGITGKAVNLITLKTILKENGINVACVGLCENHKVETGKERTYFVVDLVLKNGREITHRVVHFIKMVGVLMSSTEEDKIGLFGKNIKKTPYLWLERKERELNSSKTTKTFLCAKNGSGEIWAKQYR